MSEEETKALMDAILGGFKEQKAMIDGLTLGLAKLQGELEAFRQEVRQEFDVVEKRLDAVEGRLDGVEGRLDAVEGRLDAVEGRLDAVERRLSAVEQGQADLRAELHEGLNHLGERWLEHDRAIYSLRHRQTAVQSEAQG